jgi:riboflavin kinase/FMN adenylyltransferase
MPSGARRKALIPFALDAVPATLTGGAVAVGNFDGMHPGHVALLEATRSEADRLGAPALVLTFEPHPRTVFRPDAPVFRLTPLPAKARLLRALGIDGLVVAHFDRTFSTVSADAFVDDILVERLKLASAVVGYNFHFGKGRAGTPAMLTAAGKRLDFAVKVVDEVSGDDASPIASTVIREALANGDVASANRLLAYRWFVIAAVVAGERRGHRLGYPTANLRLGDDCRLRHGVYAVRLQRADGAILDGVANFGRRPTFDNGPPLLEVYLFDFSDELYGEEVVVTFFDWIRPEEKFASAADLTAAMDVDCRKARAILADAGPGTALDRALAAIG